MSAPVLTVPQGGPIASRPRRENLYDTERFNSAASGGRATQFVFFGNTNTNTDVNAGGTVAKTPGLDTNMPGPGGSIPRGHYLRVFGFNSYITRRQVGGNGSADMSFWNDKIRLWDMGYISLQLGPTPYLYVPFNRLCSGAGLQGPVSVGQAVTSFYDYQMATPVCSSYYDLSVPTRVRQQVDVKKVCIQGPSGKIVVRVEGGAPTKESLDRAVAAFATPSMGTEERAKVAVDVAGRIAHEIKVASVREVNVPRTPIEFSETENFSVLLTYPTRPLISNTAYFIQVNLVAIFLKPLSA